MMFYGNFTDRCKVFGKIRCRTLPAVIGYLITLGLLAAVLIFSATSAYGQSRLQQADEQFLRQLTERRFFDLAEEHCLRQIGQQTTADRKAMWQLRLCRVYEQHAWFAAAANRSGLLNSSIEQLTEFLQQQSPTVEMEFELRLQQVSTLTSSVRMSVIQAEAGHLFGSAATSIYARMLPQHAVTVDGAITICTDLLQRLEKIRGDLEPFRVREIRDTARIALAELYVLRYRLRGASEGTLQLDDVARVEEFAGMVIRSGSAERKRYARWLLAELAVVSRTTREFGLKIGAVNDELIVRDGSWGVLLKIRSLLKSQEATAAIDLATNSKPYTALQTQHVQWLKLESILGLRELAIQLEDAELLHETAQKFKAQMLAVQQTGVGVFADAADATVRRYELVDEVGSEVADLVEQIDQQRNSGNDDVALALIERSLDRLSATRSPRARGGLLLRAGEIQIAKQQWAAAAGRLQAAGPLFAGEGMSPQQAIADLLQIFCQAQIWAAAASDAKGPQQLKLGYVAGLEQHIAKFADQPTANRARQWLLKVLEPDAPHRAAGVAMDLFESQSLVVDRLAALLRAGNLLSVLNLSAAKTPDPGLVVRFRELANVVQVESAEAPGDFPAGQVAAVALCVLEFDAAAVGVTGADQWKRLDDRLQGIAAELAGLDSNDGFGTTRLRWKLLETVAGARNSAAADRLQIVRRELLALSAAQKSWLPVVAFLSAEFRVQPSRVGDIWLARTAEALISQALATQSPVASTDDICDLLPHIVRAADVTGESGLRSTALQRVFSAPLDERQLADVVSAISQTSQVGGGGDPALLKMWRDVIRQNVQGSEIWLEASLQLATIISLKEPAEARRQLDVIQTLYPDWGNAARQKRASSLSRSLR